ncbi:hypothetical protein CEXT_586331 [Caerostris extrusa]|uniref:Uncharacterized protein n=1 Tax=Caerostris extrusa TaxID=172846 RepID=A0AAV4RCR7_CAEEX|nr:hypothetical protein CEXT_586331 [Caerostris extrusa]
MPALKDMDLLQKRVLSPCFVLIEGGSSFIGRRLNCVTNYTPAWDNPSGAQAFCEKTLNYLYIRLPLMGHFISIWETMDLAFTPPPSILLILRLPIYPFIHNTPFHPPSLTPFPPPKFSSLFPSLAHSFFSGIKNDRLFGRSY